MAVTYGFFNSIGGDRQYDAETMGQLFEGIIRDGIFQKVRGGLKPTIGNSPMSVIIASGRCWFNNTWTDNDSSIELPIDPSDPILPRIDAIVVRVDKRDESRRNDIVVIKGTPRTDPTVQLPQITNVYHYPIANVRVEKGVRKLETKDLFDLRGSSITPWITGPLETISIESTINRIESEWQMFFNRETIEIRNSYAQEFEANNTQFNAWFNTLKSVADDKEITALTSRLVELETRLGQNTYGDRVIYDDLRDNNNNSILDNQGRPIQSKIVYRMVR